jgi:hypothetical protein
MHTPPRGTQARIVIGWWDATGDRAVVMAFRRDELIVTEEGALDVEAFVCRLRQAGLPLAALAEGCRQAARWPRIGQQAAAALEAAAQVCDREAAQLIGAICEECFDAPATAFAPAPWGGAMGLCAPCQARPELSAP